MPSILDRIYSFLSADILDVDEPLQEFDEVYGQDVRKALEREDYGAAGRLLKEQERDFDVALENFVEANLAVASETASAIKEGYPEVAREACFQLDGSADPEASHLSTEHFNSGRMYNGGSDIFLGNHLFETLDFGARTKIPDEGYSEDVKETFYTVDDERANELVRNGFKSACVARNAAEYGANTYSDVRQSDLDRIVRAADEFASEIREADRILHYKQQNK